MMKILIIKLGSMGDVVRTTPILHVLRGDITWITLEESIPLLKGVPSIKRVLPFRDFRKIIKEEFDWVINLEEDWKARALCQLIHAKKKTEWIDKWCLLSIDNNAKKSNRKTYQHFMFKTIGKNFNGEEYLLSVKPERAKERIVGIEKRSGGRWKMKRWNRFDKLVDRLKNNGFKYKVFGERDNILDFLRDINKCEVVITGDTLTMHLALGLKKKVIVFFGPTSSYEVYTYGRMQKLISPMKCQCCYKEECIKKPNCMDLIGEQDVLRTLKKCFVK